MKTKTRLLCLLALLFTTNSYAEDFRMSGYLEEFRISKEEKRKRNKKKLSFLGQCIACHNADGNSNAPQVPKISGLSKKYLKKQLKAFRDGSRNNDIMTHMTIDLTDEQIGIAAKFFSKKDRRKVKYKYTKVSSNRIERAKKSKTKLHCLACHLTYAPNIRNQHAGYIFNQLKAFKNGDRRSKKMEKMVEEMTEEDMLDFAYYFESF